jgi:hypothetical protein
VSGTVIRQRDSALPDEHPAARNGPLAIESDSVAAFARDLRVLRSKAGLDYPDMAEKSHYTMRTLASAAGGLRLPTLPVLIAYVQACDGDVGAWEDRWAKLAKSSKKGAAALPAAGQSATDDGPDAEHRPTEAEEAEPPGGSTPSGEVYVITSARPRDAQW